ncbi:MAG: porin family protein [Elusimicrobiota bacterium]
MHSIASTLTALTISLLLAAGAASPASAQDYDREHKKPSRAQRKQKRVSKTAQKAKEARVTENGGERISYQQIFKNPDDIDLNFRYAKQQIADGNLKGASVTLERILMVNPALPRVRLLMAVVFFRLDNLHEAKRELDAVKDLPMPASLKEEVDEYLRLIASRMRSLNFTGRFSAAFQYDTNRNAAPNSNQRLFGNVPLDLVTGRKEDDIGYIGIARIGATYDPGSQAGHELFFNYSYYRAEQVEISIIDLQAHSWDGGFTYKSRFGDFSVGPVFGYVTLDANKPYLRTRAGRLTWKRVLGKTIALDASFKTGFEEFIISRPNLTVAEERTGYRTEFRLGGGYVLAPAHYVTLHYNFVDKDARKEYNAYYRHGIRGSHQWLLGKGRFVLSSVAASVDQYRLADFAIASGARSDNIVRVGLTYGTPLDFAHKSLKNLILTANYGMFHSFSNITNYEYTNHTLNVMFTYKFDY